MPTDPYIGEIMMVPFNFAPRGWLMCDGRKLKVSEYPELFALIGAAYGGDGRTTFAVPDLRGRVPIGAGQSPGLQYRPLGYRFGAEEMTLTNYQLPNHTHTATFHPTSDEGSSGSGTGTGTVTGTVKVTEAEADSSTPGANCVLGKVKSTNRGVDPQKIYSTTGSADKQLRNDSVTGTSSGGGGITGGFVEVDDQGQGLPFEMLQPSLAINFCIAIEGMFPPRN